jgi:hypothetical protein
MGNYEAAFMHPLWTHMVLSLSDVDSINASFSSNLTPALDEGLLY